MTFFIVSLTSLKKKNYILYNINMGSIDCSAVAGEKGGKKSRD